MKRYLWIYYTETQYYGCDFPCYFKTYAELKAFLIDRKCSNPDQRFIDLVDLDTGNVDTVFHIDMQFDEDRIDDLIERIEETLTEKGLMGL